MTAPRIETNTRGQGHRLPAKRRWRVAVNIVAGAAVVAAAVSVGGIDFDNEVYQDHLQLIQSQSVRNTNHDNSSFRDVKQDELVQADFLGPRTDYLGNPNGNPEQHFPTENGGQFRTSCEFSHFGYDDPILFPDKPGAAHLHMFFGNTDVNAYTTQETLEDSGGGTCNGQEINRSGYWAPALFDGDGNVRIPERIVIYYKGEVLNNSGRHPTDNLGRPSEGSQIYERGMRAIAPSLPSIQEIPLSQGGASTAFDFNFKCTNNFSADFPPATVGGSPNGQGFMPNCDGDFYPNTFGGNAYPGTRTVLEMEIRFWQCFPWYDESNPNAATNPDVTDWTLWSPPPVSTWFNGDCNDDFFLSGNLDEFESYPHFRYFVNYVVEPGETTEDWYLSSDVDPATIGSASPQIVGTGNGSTLHGDAWWEWQDQTLQQALDNCVNFYNPNANSGCGLGYLSDGGPNNQAPLPGPALAYRPQFDTVGDSASYKVPASQIFAELCQPLGPAHSFTTDAHAAYCKP